MKIRTADLFAYEGEIIAELFRGCTYPWQIIPRIHGYILSLIAKGIEGYSEISEGILVGCDVKIHESAVLTPPLIIGHGTEIRPGAYIRGSVIIGDGCVVGNSCELKNCILLRCAQVPHYNYVGDSILGVRAHMGAGAVCSNLKSDKSEVLIGKERINTGLRKLGAILADGVEIGCGCVLNPGTVIGKNTTVYPLVATRGVYSEDSIVKNTATVVKKTR